MVRQDCFNSTSFIVKGMPRLLNVLLSSVKKTLAELSVLGPCGQKSLRPLPPSLHTQVFTGLIPIQLPRYDCQDTAIQITIVRTAVT